MEVPIACCQRPVQISLMKVLLFRLLSEGLQMLSGSVEAGESLGKLQCPHSIKSVGHAALGSQIHW